MGISVSELLPLIVIVFLIGLLVFMEWRNDRERRDLIDRLMSRDFGDYVNHDNSRKTIKIPDKIKPDETKYRPL